jgi:hypothetical protein
VDTTPANQATPPPPAAPTTDTGAAQSE